MDNFVHLEVQSAFSFLWGAFLPADLVERVAAIGQPAVALTDTGLHGVVQFQKAARAAGVQPVIGARLNIWDGSPITLLVTNSKGYSNLCRLLSIGLGDKMRPNTRLTRQDLANWSKGLVCIAGGWGSLTREFLGRQRLDSARQSLLSIKEVFRDTSRLFVALQNHDLPGKGKDGRHGKRLVQMTEELSESLKLSVVATNLVTFLEPEDHILHKTLVGIQTEHHHRDIGPLPNNSFSLISSKEMLERVSNSDAIGNTIRIAEMCKGFSLPLGKLHPPRIQEPAAAAKDLTKLCYREMAEKCRPATLRYMNQLEDELKVIKDMKLSDFFLLVRKVVDFAGKNGIRHSVRGSAAGSLALYLLLGGVDPVANRLLFERFINEGRADMPDIDIDFDSQRRDEVINYLLDLFPKQTAMVCTINSLKARSAVRMTARALGYPLDEIGRLARCLPWSLRGRNLLESLEKLPELQDSPLKKEGKLVRLAARLTGLPFQCSVHLGGVIIAPDHINSWTPVGFSPKGMPVGHLDKDDVEALGLLKLDLLGLRMHTAINKAMEVLRRHCVSLRLERTPLNDPRTYALLRSTESIGVFQVESPGQRNLLGRLQPRRFSDLVAEISLFRPGPVEGNMVDSYVFRRNGEEKVDIPHPDLAPILSETYGIILFQEQVLRVAHVFAGLSYGDADAFRRAMTKDRNSKKMDQLKGKFMEGALKKGHHMELIEKVFEQIAAFASYGFCKAHAASFAHITYQSAYLKAHHPQAFYIGLLNAGHVGSYPASLLLNEARRRGIPIYGPHVNSSGEEYLPDGSGIRVPLTVINNLGDATSRRIIAERKNRGLFTCEADLVMRISLPKRIMGLLRTAGALDALDRYGEEFNYSVL